MRQVAIIGLSSSHDLAPWGDSSWEKWGLPWDEGYWIRCDRLFEMHDLRLLESEHSKRPKDYMDRLMNIDVPLYMQESYFLNATRYPFEEVAKNWNSSIGYMIALAIHERVDRIGLWGVDMKHSEEYGYQRPNTAYLLGLAEGLGIELVNCDHLLAFNPEGIKFFDMSPKYVERYGWLG